MPVSCDGKENESEDVALDDGGEDKQIGEGLCCSSKNQVEARHRLRPLPVV